jgi:RNA polymerase sigma-70 factor (ECF subfamily)
MSEILTPATGWRSRVDPIVVTTGEQLKVEIERLHTASFGWALACCRGRRDEAEDVLQSVYLKVLSGKARFDGKSAINTWLLAVVRTTASEQRRSRWLRHLAFARWLAGRPEPADANDVEVADLRSDACRQVREALSRLPARQGQVLHLVFYEELTVEQAAHVLGVSVGTARTHFDRGKRKLRALLAPETTR